MIECSGVCYFNTAEAVTGRLCHTDTARAAHSDIAQILLWNGKDELSDALLSSAVGVVFPNDISENAIKSASRLARFCRLPALGVDLPSGLSRDCIAILDSARSRLYVNPDLETINSYFGAHARECKPSTRALLETDRAVSISGTQYRGLVTQRQGDADEQKYYEHLCELADTNTGAELIAVANAADVDSFISDVRAIYRAGVWGRVSLLCTSVHTPKQADERVMMLHTVFRMLEGEGREFNGFIPKGLLVDAPLLLLSTPRHTVLDFFCVDFEKIRRLLTCSDDTGVGEAETVRYVEEFAKKAHGAALSLRGTESISKQTLSSLIENISPSSIYSKADRTKM